jgi:phosphotransferase system enzyme I (PtsP)
MLDSLRSIIQEVSTAEDLRATLDILVNRVSAALDTEVCSVYMLDTNTNRYVLMATEGLDSAAVGVVSLAPEEGLVGLVAERAEPINLADVSTHPRFRYLPETREEAFSSFLGVPVIHHGDVLGVLVVQQQETRDFDSEHEAFLITLSAQLAGIIAHALARGSVLELTLTGERRVDNHFSGVAASPGVVIASAIALIPEADLNAVPMRRVKDVKGEIEYFNECLENVRQDINELKFKIRNQLRPEERELFDAYLHMLSDDSLGAEVVALIEQGNWAQGALAKVALSYVASMERIEDAYLRERATDIKDLCIRVLSYLQSRQKKERIFPNRFILMSEELSAASLAEVPRENLVGLISSKGSEHSHVAILARSMGIPAVMGISELPLAELDGEELIIDGYNGRLFSNPSDETRRLFEEIVKEEVELSVGLASIKELPTETLDGKRIELWVNTGLITDVLRSLERGAEGIGLFRTEVPFLLRESFPSEREQTIIYREQLEAFHPKLVTMRTLDIGGDKPLPYFPIKEDNPFLGWRGIRVSMDHPELFLTQVRAMIRASEGLDNLQILLPMVSQIPEVDRATRLIRRAHAELVEDGLKASIPSIGAMIEVPGLAMQVDQLAGRVDFISVGSNDLTQYTLAVDRNNPQVSALFSTMHPAVLRLLNNIADAAQRHGKSLSICGEMAGNPVAAVLLMAMGYEVLSMNANNLLKVKAVIRSISLTQAKELLEAVLQKEDIQAVKVFMDHELEKAGVNRLLRSLQNN